MLIEFFLMHSTTLERGKDEQIKWEVMIGFYVGFFFFNYYFLIERGKGIVFIYFLLLLL